jgi:hypothetical protein
MNNVLINNTKIIYTGYKSCAPVGAHDFLVLVEMGPTREENIVFFCCVQLIKSIIRRLEIGMTVSMTYGCFCSII